MTPSEYQEVRKHILSDNPVQWRLGLIDLAICDGQLTPELAELHVVMQDTPTQ